MRKLIAVWALVLLAGYACVHQYETTRYRSAYELACADVAEEYGIETCVLPEPDIVYNSLLVRDLTGAMGVSVYPERRIYLSPAEYIRDQGYTVEDVLYHEMIHMVLAESWPLERCASEAKAREMTDRRYGTESSKVPWRVFYQCNRVPSFGVPGV